MTGSAKVAAEPDTQLVHVDPSGNGGAADGAEDPHPELGRAESAMGLGDEEEERPYNVQDFYWEDEDKQWYKLGTPASKLAKHKKFEAITLAVISANGIWIGIDTDWNNPALWPEIVFTCAENVFCVYFTFEVLVRFFAFKDKRNCLKDGWFKFDSILVAMMIFETWIVLAMDGGAGGGLSQLSILRLMRLSRLVRLMRSVPELLTLVKGMFAATRSVFSTLVLLVAFLYIFGIIFTQTYRDVPGEWQQMLFGCMGCSMLTLFINGTLLDNLTATMIYLRDDNAMMMWIFVIFILVSSFTVLNMLIGVLCGVVTETAASEAESMGMEQANQKLKEVFLAIDTDGSGLISQNEFMQMKDNPLAVEALEQLGIEVHMVMNLTAVLFQDDDDDSNDPSKMFRKSAWDPLNPKHAGRDSVKSSDIPPGTKELEFKEFLERLAHLKPGSTPSVLDFADLQKQLCQSSLKLQKRIVQLQKKLLKLGAPHPDTMEQQNQAVEDKPIELGKISTDDLLNELSMRLAQRAKMPAQ